MPTRPERRIVTAEEVMQEQVDAFETPEDPEEPRTVVEYNTRKLTSTERLHRRLRMADMMLERYERLLEEGKDLTPEQERLFLAHQNSVRQLEATLSALEHRGVQEKEKTPLELALELQEAGWSKEDLSVLFRENPEVLEKLYGDG